MDQPPPPPPPHGDNPKTTNGAGGGLGPGNYDIFVIPQRDKGGGFIYLPAMNANGPSFAAGFASALILVVIFQSIAPAFQAWWSNFEGMGTTGMFTLILAVGLVAWAMGQWQAQAAPANGASGAGGAYGGASPGANAGAAPNAGSAPPPPPRNDPPPNHNGSAGNPPPKSSWQQPPPGSNTRSEEPPPQSAPPPPPPQPSAWERARQETKRKEEERKKKEEEEKRKAEAARRLREFREKEAREREKREREAKERKEKAEKEEKEKEELKQKLQKETAERERLEKEKAEREAKEKEEARKKDLEEKRKQEVEERKKREAEAAARTARQGSTYAYSGVGEKTSPWPKGTNPPPPPSSAPRSTAPPTKPARSTASTDKSGRPPAPSARTHLGADDDAYSYRPYDQPKKAHRRAPSSIGSESSWAPSATTARTTPPPSMRGPYTTKDPDKIVIKAVYLFMNQFAKTPASNLLSGVGSVTDGLILRVTTAGLFIDDDVRGVPQREWDVKAWTLKSVEVWCPPHCLFAPASSASGSSANQPSSFLHKMAASQFGRQADRSASKTFVGDDADVYLNELLRTCRECCRLGLCDGKLRDTNASTSAGQTGQWKARGLHLLRATVKDQEGKRYLVVLDDEEAWKLSAGLQRLRKGTQARTLNVSGMSASDARGTLDMLGWIN